ncbi:hypothetical protein HanIR_Chr15g0757911 [Helianthus annuus]|nr:hypothetical protein HanIR_Chr15g0757911 [Helianthus annuus]
MASPTSSDEINEFFLNVVMEATQIIIEEEETSSKRRKRQQCLNRDREGAHDRLMADYFAKNPVYTDEYLGVVSE